MPVALTNSAAAAPLAPSAAAADVPPLPPADNKESAAVDNAPSSQHTRSKKTAGSSSAAAAAATTSATATTTVLSPGESDGGGKVGRKGSASRAAAGVPAGKKCFRVKGNLLVVDARYEVFNPVGYGAYGVVCAGRDHVTGKRVAIKKIPKVFMDLVDGKRILRELLLLPYLRHENVMGILDLMRPQEGKDSFDDLYLVCELMETDLHQVIKSKQQLTNEHIQYFIYQIFRALKYIHSAGVIHRDLKPGNVLVNSNCDVKLCDFGLARGGLDTQQRSLELTDYVVTRWYRPPELLLMCRYSTAIDLWSCGCILAELHNRRALFPGRDYINQLTLITDVLGTPASSDVSFVRSEEALSYLKTMPRKKAKSFAAVVPTASKPCLNLIESLVAFNPDKRISADDALKVWPSWQSHLTLREGDTPHTYTHARAAPVCRTPLRSR